MNNQKKYIIFDSPSHSWMQVAISELKELNILEEISPFSYTDGEFAYLEEDMDMGTFIYERLAVTGKMIDWETDTEREYVKNFPHHSKISPI